VAISAGWGRRGTPQIDIAPKRERGALPRGQHRRFQLRHALILAVNGTEAALSRDFVVRRREPDGGFVWHVPSSFLDDEELTPDAWAK
jgi:hypothetical protein